MILLSKRLSEIHHHTGGLEKNLLTLITHMIIHHHTGGLEKTNPSKGRSLPIHHHTGGLENSCCR